MSDRPVTSISSGSDAGSRELFEEQIKARTSYIESVLEKFRPEEKGEARIIYEAMNYSLMAGGKRMRPLLMLESARLFGEPAPELIEPMMAAIEMIHTYSLVHDDLPAIDNDDYRRGRLTSHKIYGEGMAVLAGDALLSCAYQLAAGSFDAAASFHEKEMLIKAIQVMARESGIYGMVAGQVVDVSLSGSKIPEATLKYIFENKTAAMIRASMHIGAILGGADEEQQEIIRQAALKTGTAFQIIDDILDETSSLEELGKLTGSDKKNQKTTWVTLRGMEGAKADADKLSREAMDLIASMPGSPESGSSFLYSYIKWLLDRKN